MKPITLYSGTVGLNTVLDPQRLSQGTKNNPGLVELAVAVNVSIDDRGLVSLRKGDTSKAAGSFHSLFCAGGDCFVIQERTNDAALMSVSSGYVLTGLRSGLTKNRPMSFAQENGNTWYSNGLQNGVVKAGASAAWPVDTYNGPDTNFRFTPAPVGNHIAIQHGGLMLIAEGSTLWVNHEPFAYGLYNQRSGFVLFASPITMICPVASGVFVSDATATWFLRGTSWFDWVQVKVADYPAIEWTLANDPIALRDAGMDADGFCRYWVSTAGPCLGLDNGTLINLKKDEIVYPAGITRGAGLVTNTSLIHTVY